MPIIAEIPQFIDSPFFGGLIAAIATLLTGGAAIWVFYRQRKDQKVNAAISVLFEIRNAESNISILRERFASHNLMDLPSVLPVNSWRQYSHLFARDFDEDEFKLLNGFYNSCTIIEDLVRRQNDFIWIAAEERAKVAQQMLGEVHLEFQRDFVTGGEANTAINQRKFNAEKEGVTRYFADEGYFYAPQKATESLKYHIESVSYITPTTCGAKLKGVAKQ